MDITSCTYKVGGIVEKIKKLFSSKYAVIRRDDLSVIVEMDYFPENQKSMMYRNGRRQFFTDEVK